MQFLLTAVNAKYIHSNPAVYSLRAYAGAENRKHIAIAEYTINNRMEDILADIYQRNPDVIAFSCYIWNWNMIQDIIVELHKIMPDLPIWLGGPEVSYDASVIIKKYPMITGIMIGEGEVTFRELLEYYVRLADAKAEFVLPAHIAGLALQDGRTPVRELTELSQIPFLYEDLEEFENRIIYYESSRGCPYHCSYCLSSIDKSVRFRDLELVKRELRFFLEHKVPQVKFVDRTFNCSHSHAMAIWQFILENDNSVTNFHFEVSADIINEEEIALLHQMRPGLVQLEIGVQSVNPATLHAINRNMNLDRLEQIVAAIHKGQNIHQHLDLIAGLPYEDYDTFVISFNRVYHMRPQQLQLGFLKVLKGSNMYERAQEYGINYTDKPPYEVLYSRWLPYKDVLRLKGIEEMVELYYNSNQYTHTLSYLEHVFPHPFALFEALAAFYEEKGYFTASPSRAYRYEVLLAFAVSCDACHEALYRELLTYDMYLRENLKSRPAFARDWSGQSGEKAGHACRREEGLEIKEAIREFYHREEDTREYLPGYESYDSRQLSKMTHIEPFYYPVWHTQEEWEKMEEKQEDPTLILFDYRSRNPLTYEARTVKIPIEVHRKETL